MVLSTALESSDTTNSLREDGELRLGSLRNINPWHHFVSSLSHVLDRLLLNYKVTEKMEISIMVLTEGSIRISYLKENFTCHWIKRPTFSANYALQYTQGKKLTVFVQKTCLSGSSLVDQRLQSRKSPVVPTKSAMSNALSSLCPLCMHAGSTFQMSIQARLLLSYDIESAVVRHMIVEPEELLADSRGNALRWCLRRPLEKSGLPLNVLPCKHISSKKKKSRKKLYSSFCCTLAFCRPQWRFWARWEGS